MTGQLYDPFVYLGYLAASTQNIALGVSSIVLPLRYPAHVAKATMSAVIAVRVPTDVRNFRTFIVRPPR